jgi:hypothetical protein
MASLASPRNAKEPCGRGDEEYEHLSGQTKKNNEKEAHL